MADLQKHEVRDERSQTLAAAVVDKGPVVPELESLVLDTPLSQDPRTRPAVVPQIRNEPSREVVPCRRRHPRPAMDDGTKTGHVSRLEPPDLNLQNRQINIDQQLHQGDYGINHRQLYSYNKCLNN